jgi:molecular chaperone HscB
VRLRQLVLDVTPMADPDHFERLGLPRRFALAGDALERNYLARSREVHPDLAGDSGEVLDAAARLNEAYATLKDPFRRAEYLLTLEGGPSAGDVKQSPPAFLEEMLELRMEIEGVKDDPAARSVLEKQLAARRSVLLAEAGELLDRLPSTGDRPATLLTIRQTLNATRYVNGLFRDLAEE